MKQFIDVQAQPGTRCFTKPIGGREIPADKPLNVLFSPWIANYLRSGDLIEVKEAAAAGAAAPIAAAGKSKAQADKTDK